MRYVTPLRYPGGKARLATFFRDLIMQQDPPIKAYAEPFAGGAGAALKLLQMGAVEEILINDINPGIAAFWRTITHDTDSFIKRLDQVPVTVSEWKKQHEIYTNPAEHDDLELGFATFFLNRTNRSGILDARPIGGLDQSGTYPINARYNKVGLTERIEAVAKMSSQICVFELDAIDFLRTLNRRSEGLFVYADPPYVTQGNHLYLHGFTEEMHRSLAVELQSASYQWVVTYDDEELIWGDLYKEQNCARFNIAHTAQINHFGRETIIYGPHVMVPEDLEITPGVQTERVSNTPQM